MAILRTPRRPTYGPYGQSSAPTGMQATAQGYVPTVRAAPRATPQFRPVAFARPPTPQSIFQQAAQEHGSAGFGNLPVRPPGPTPQSIWDKASQEHGSSGFGNQPDVSNIPLGPPGSINIPGYFPDLPGAVWGDPEMAAVQGAIAAANAADAAAARQNINAMAVDWGGDLQNLVKTGLIDQRTADAAKANQFSQMADLQHTLEVGQGSLQAQLAARGILNSGALPGGTAQLNRQFQQASTTGLENVMNQISAVRAQQAQAAASRQGNIASAYGDIASRLAQDPRYQTIPNMTASWNQQLGGYVDDWGRVFNAQGQRTG
jgi:hypothetical protein